jgi:lactate 2-monooxygenase
VRKAQEANKLTVLFDSGIRTGSDIIKAMALGAQGVLCECRFYLALWNSIAHRDDKVGRPWVYGLAIGGQEGVEQVVKQTLAELEITMGLCGYSSLSEICGRRDEIITKVDL